MPFPVIAVHGGCGTPDRSALPSAVWEELRHDLAQALRSGWAVLQAGGSALDAVQSAVVVLEDSPHFNAGCGSAFTSAATHELDASIMEGRNGRAGAVCTVRRIRNPVLAAREVMDRSQCVLLSGEEADRFAASCGLAMVDNSYFTTARRSEALARIKAHRHSEASGRADRRFDQPGRLMPGQRPSEADRHGTVGAVALDSAGHLAAATSTGGYNNKPCGRVGDSPLIGAGTFARDGVCAVSCTGVGEYFIRQVAAHDICARMQYLGESLAQACDRLVHHVMPYPEAGAGIIGVDAAGSVHAAFNTDGMARGWITRGEGMQIGTHAAMLAVD